MDDDLAVVEQVKSGKTEAFSELVNKYKKPVLNLVWKMTGRRNDAEDIAQEVFLRAFKGLGGFKSEAKFFTWLYRIAVNLSLRIRKRNSKFIFQSLEEKTEEGSREVRMAASNDEDPGSKVLRTELQQKVKEAIMGLEESQRAVIILYRYQNLSYQEIADTLNISVPAVKSRIHRARNILKEKLEKYVKTDTSE